MNEVVKFPINTPVGVTLQSEAGKRVQGRYGPQVMYSLLDDRVMYVPPYVEQRFQELAIGAGDPLLLCRREVKDGDRDRIEWSVKRDPQPSPAPASGMDSVVPSTTLALPPVGIGREKEMVARNGEGTPGENQTVALALDDREHEGGDGMEGVMNGIVRREEQPSANSTAPMAQESVATKTQHQQQDNAGRSSSEIVLASARPLEISTKDSVFLPAMSMEVALARRAAIVEFCNPPQFSPSLFSN